MVDWLTRWKWVCLYILLIFTTAGSLGTWVQTVYDSFGQGVVKVGTLALLCVSAFVVSLRALRRGFTITPYYLAGLLFLGICYLTALIFLAPYPVEKIHFLEYGLLSYLIFTAFRKEKDKNPFFKTLTLVFLVGFLDEIYQGILPVRQYDNQDVLLNLISGILGLFLTAYLRKERPSSPFNGFAFFRNLGYFALWILGVLIYIYVHAVPYPTERVWGTWHRVGYCHINEWMGVKPDGTFFWWDEAGNHAKGIYKITKNRLEGAFFRGKGIHAENLSDCGWTKGLSMQFRIVLDLDQLTFLQHPDKPWKRESTTVPSRNVPLPGR